MLAKPAWLKNQSKKIPDQLTIVSKKYSPESTGYGRDGRPQVSMPVSRMLHENEEVLNSATVNALGGKEGVTNMVMSELQKRGINKMPMPEMSSIKKATDNNAQVAGENVGAGYIGGTVFDNLKNAGQSLVGAVGGLFKEPERAPSISRGTASPNLLAPAPQPVTTQEQPLQTLQYKSPTWDTPSINPNNTPDMPLAAPQPLIRQPEILTFTPPPQDAQTDQKELDRQAVALGFKDAAEYRAADKLIGKPGEAPKASDYYAELAARSTTAQMPDAKGMKTFRQQYDYAAQQADARAAVSDQDLAMKMAQNPNLTEGAKNTMLQEQVMAQGAQQSKLAGDAAQSAYGIQRDESRYADETARYNAELTRGQNQKAMDSMLAAGDVDGYAKMFQEEFGMPIDKTAMSSTLNQKALSTSTNGLNTRIAQLGDNATLADPLTKQYLQGIWAATGNTGAMTDEWANGFLQRERDSYDPVYQAMKFYPEASARLLWGDNAIDNMVDELTRTTGYNAFQRKYARGMATAFSSYDPATQDFKVANDSFLESLFNPQSGGVDLGATSGTTGATGTTTETPTFSYTTLATGSTVDYGGKKWTVGQDVDGSKILRADDGTWARVDSKNKLYTYTSDNTTGTQTIAGKTYVDGKEVTAAINGRTRPISDDGDGAKYIYVSGQKVPVTINADKTVSIEGSFVDGGKLYVKGKEVKAGGGTISFADSEKATEEIKSNGYTLGTSAGKTYIVKDDGSAPRLYSVEDYMSNPTPEGLKTAIANDGVDAVWTSYKNKVADKVDAAVLDTLIDAGSPKAKEYVPTLLSTGKVDISKYPNILASVQKIATNPGTGSASTGKNIWGETYHYSNLISTKDIPAPGTITKIGDRFYYVESSQDRTDTFPQKNGDAAYKYPRTLISLDGSGTKITQNYIGG